MKPLHEGDRVTAVYMNGEPREIRRGLVGRGNPKRLRSAYAVDADIIDTWLNFLSPEREGISWARGWKTRAADALRVRVALL